MKIIRSIFIISGIVLITMIILACTPLPFYAWYGLSMKKAGINRVPEVVIVLGGGGMPSESGLMRTWYAAKLGNRFPQSKVIIALPGNIRDSLSALREMKSELISRGIISDRIILEDSGTNTRSQALQIRQLYFETSPADQPAFVIVTSPEHLFRAVKTFEKTGLYRVDGLPAFESALEADISFNGKKIGRRQWVPEVGKNLGVRYNFWTQVRYEMILLREYLAIGYYWMNGWI